MKFVRFCYLFEYVLLFVYLICKGGAQDCASKSAGTLQDSLLILTDNEREKDENEKKTVLCPEIKFRVNKAGIKAACFSNKFLLRGPRTPAKLSVFRW